jgi:hypothetical protein
VPGVCEFLAKSSKDFLVEDVDRSNAENKLIDFLVRAQQVGGGLLTVVCLLVFYVVCSVLCIVVSFNDVLCTCFLLDTPSMLPSATIRKKLRAASFHFLVLALPFVVKAY